MVFSSPIFLFLFLPAVLLGVRVLPRRAHNAFLLAMSLLFYAFGETFHAGIMLASILVNYLVALGMERWRGTPTARTALIAAVIFNLGLLCIFKYANFLVDNVNILVGMAGGRPIELRPVHLPIGISFFTFQALSYAVDVYRGRVPASKNVLHVGLYVSLFPQLIAGPIVRYRDIAAEILRRAVSRADFAAGIRRFIAGLGKKVLIANVVAWPADRIFDLPAADLSAASAWLGIVCYAIQIYFDFSGYSDMAIGLGRMLGFHFHENFDYPYISRSLTEFWRRWHISLSTWFRDYLYIPLGGNRISAPRTCMNLFVVFFLCGLWHGSSWNFVVWGLLHGSLLIVERALPALRQGDRLPTLRRIYALLAVLVAWVFFRATSLDHAGNYLAAMAGLGAVSTPAEYPVMSFITPELGLALVAGVVGATPVLPRLQRLCALRGGAVETVWWPLGGAAAGAAVLLASVMKLAAGTHNPFIYFRF
ncbi:MAG: MBOAT family protein [Lentisphaerae bacterium]|nr:MBOAT family protein [Lentisphaerota bacterium]